MRYRTHACDMARSCAALLAGAMWVLGCRAPAPESASTVTLVYPGDERVLGPHWDMPAKFLVFLPLAETDETGELRGRLAVRWDHSPDYRRWTIHLRPGVTWHDGVPFTAHDVQFTLGLLSHPGINWQVPASVDIIDDSTFTIAYESALESPLSTWQVFYPKHLLDGLPPDQFTSWDFWTQPVGNGPYRYRRHVPQTLIELEANPDYYDGPPPITRLRLKLVQNVGLVELLSGEADAAPYVTPTEVLKAARDERFRVYHEVYGDQLRAVLWNQRHPALADARVRRALTMAIDRHQLLQVLHLPTDLPLTDVLSTNRQFRQRQLPEPLPYDTAKAAALLDSAGWRTASGGARARHGVPLAFRLMISQADETEAVFVQDALRRLGVRVEIERTDLGLVRRRIRTGDFDAAIRILGNELGGNFGQIRMFGRESPLGYRNAEVAALLEAAAETFDPAVQDTLFRQIMVHFSNDIPITVLHPGVMHVVAHRSVQGLSSPFRAEPTTWMHRLALARKGQ